MRRGEAVRVDGLPEVFRIGPLTNPYVETEALFYGVGCGDGFSPRPDSEHRFNNREVPVVAVSAGSRAAGDYAVVTRSGVVFRYGTLGRDEKEFAVVAPRDASLKLANDRSNNLTTGGFIVSSLASGSFLHRVAHVGAVKAYGCGFILGFGYLAPIAFLAQSFEGVLLKSLAGSKARFMNYRAFRAKCYVEDDPLDVKSGSEGRWVYNTQQWIAQTEMLRREFFDSRVHYEGTHRLSQTELKSFLPPFLHTFGNVKGYFSSRAELGYLRMIERLVGLKETDAKALMEEDKNRTKTDPIGRIFSWMF